MPIILLASYTDSIRALFFDPAQRTLLPTSSFPSGGNASWISRSPVDSSLIVGTNEKDEGEVRLFRMAVEGTGVSVSELGSASSGGRDPAHHLVLESGDEVVAANYNGGSILSLPLTSTSLGPALHPLIKFPFIGPGPNASRQESSHPHQVYQRTPSELLIPDLGADKIWRLGRSSTSGEWTIAGSVECEVGVGPRHVICKGTDLYVLNELANSLSHYSLPAALDGSATHHSTQPCTFTPAPTSGAAELLLHPSGAYLYATNRDGENVAGDSIAIFSLATSLLSLGARVPTFVKEVRTGLQHPRGAILEEYEGKLYLVVAGVKAGGVKVYEVTGGGEELEQVAHVDADKVTGFLWV